MRQWESEQWNTSFQVSQQCIWRIPGKNSGNQHLVDEAQHPTVTLSSLRSPQTSGPSIHGFMGFKAKEFQRYPVVHMRYTDLAWRVR